MLSRMVGALLVTTKIKSKVRTDCFYRCQWGPSEEMPGCNSSCYIVLGITSACVSLINSSHLVHNDILCYPIGWVSWGFVSFLCFRHIFIDTFHTTALVLFKYENNLQMILFDFHSFSCYTFSPFFKNLDFEN